VAHVTYLRCDCHPAVYQPGQIKRLVANHCCYGYDVMAHVGRELFERNQTVENIKISLADKNVHISSSEISHLSVKFIVYLSIAHQKVIGKIKENMLGNGGYILHVDGTCDGDSPHLMSALDQVSGFVLHNVKIPTENAGDIEQMLLSIKHMYGQPVCVVTDMAMAFSKAITAVFKDAKHFICHFHFLRDTGKDLLSDVYDRIRKQLKGSKIRNQLKYRLRNAREKIESIDASQMGSSYRELVEKNGDEDTTNAVCCIMLMWCLDAKNAGAGHGFPFDRPHFEFYKRITITYKKLNTINQILVDKGKPNKLVKKALNDLKPVMENEQVRRDYLEMCEKTIVFDNLRTALQISLDDSGKGLNDTGETKQMKTIETRVRDFRQKTLCSSHSKKEEYQKMICQIDKYWDKLFADPIEIQKEDGTKLKIQPQRTNNILEQFFRKIKHAYRKRTGNNKTSRFLKAMPPDTPLVKNLKNHQYMKILLGKHKNLEELFSSIENGDVIKKMREAETKNDLIPKEIKKAIRKPETMKKFLNLQD
jgi:hypothetical protein